MTRKEQIEIAALRIHDDDDIRRFIAGAKWADENPAVSKEYWIPKNQDYTGIYQKFDNSWMSPEDYIHVREILTK